MKLDQIKQVENLRHELKELEQEWDSKATLKSNALIASVKNDFTTYFTKEGFTVDVTSAGIVAKFNNTSIMLNIGEPFSTTSATIVFELEINSTSVETYRVLVNPKQVKGTTHYNKPSEIENLQRSIDNIQQKIVDLDSSKWLLHLQEEASELQFNSITEVLDHLLRS
jgi:hypothetical protein